MELYGRVSNPIDVHWMGSHHTHLLAFFFHWGIEVCDTSVDFAIMQKRRYRDRRSGRLRHAWWVQLGRWRIGYIKKVTHGAPLWGAILVSLIVGFVVGLLM